MFTTPALRRLRDAVHWAAPLCLIPLLLILSACNDSSSNKVYPPAAPDALLAEAGDGLVIVSWSAVAGADTYNLYWGTAPGLTTATSDRVGGIVATDYTVSGLVNGTTYYFALTAVSSVGEGVLSPEIAITLPPGVVDLISVSAGDAIVTITWNDVFGATSYNLYRSTTPGVTSQTGVLIADVVSPYEDTIVVNGTTYYYVLTALGPGGESADSRQVSATPQPPLGGPENPAVTVLEEAPRTLLISWDPPTVGNPDSYNIYWDNTPGVAVGTNPILDVVTPYLHTGLTGQETYYYVITAVEGGFESPPSAEVSGTPYGGAGGGGGSGDEGFGNNLSYPLLFADGYGITGMPIDGTVDPWLDFATGLRPTATDIVVPFPYFDPTTAYDLNGTLYYEQKSANTWQAAWFDGSSATQDVIVDWGDNLTSVSFTTNSVIRVETTLYQDATIVPPTDVLTGYQMALLYGAGITEMQGTDAVTYVADTRHVYAVNGRLTIEKLVGPGGAVDPTVDGFDAATYERYGLDGPGGFGAEINVGGKLVYGYVWMLSQWEIPEPDKLGWWRITFSLDPQATFGTPAVTVDNNVRIVALDPSETVATLDVPGNQTWIEIEVTN